MKNKKGLNVNIFNKIRTNKKAMYLISVSVLILFCFALNVSFSLFTNSSLKDAANIKIKNMTYSMTINGSAGTIITATANDKVRSNVSVSSLNELNSKYELIYHICADSTCETYINKPDGLTIEYSSRTIDPVTGTIESSGNKNIRIIVTNTTTTTYYIKLDMNAGYAHNTLALQNLITSMYDEDDVIIAAYVDGNLQQTFPTTGAYDAIVSCKVNGNSSNATGEVNWNGTKWTVDIRGADIGETRCNVNFNTIVITQFNTSILANNNGADTISAKTTPTFSNTATTDEGMFAATDDSGTSYYFRGAVTNNWVRFGKDASNNTMYWRIIRINGDGTVRMVYSGTTAPTSETSAVMTGSGTNAVSGVYNSSSDYNEYVGYRYQIYLNAHGTSNASPIEGTVEDWYNSNINTTGYSSYVNDSTFCNDRTVTTGNGYGQKYSVFAPNTRLITNKTPILTCSNTSDYFGVTSGNATLGYPVGLITADEIAMAGGVAGTNNTAFYLYTNQSYWTMTPSNFYVLISKTAYVLHMSSAGNIENSTVSNSEGIRPVLTLKVNTGVSGTGTWSNPYYVRNLITS